MCVWGGLFNDAFSRKNAHHGHIRKSRILEKWCNGMSRSTYEGWNFNSGNYLFTTDTK